MICEGEKMSHYQFLQGDGLRTASLEGTCYIYEFHKKWGNLKKIWDSAVRGFWLQVQKK